MKVKTLRKHDNAYGNKFEKEPGDEYDHPSPQGLIDQKLVAEVKPAAAAKEADKGASASK
jgi:hypothetical protein